jgi:glycosyltransferase involved in cell wall biosynthesis
MKFIKYKPKVSIIIAAYNSEKYIKFAIASVQKQRYENWELIIVNDCSTDSTRKIIKKYQSKKILTINLKNNVGPYRATNFAFKKATGTYIAILDSDDYSHPDRIASQVSELEKNKNTGLVLTQFHSIDQNNKIIKNVKNKKFISVNNFNKRFPCENLACNSSAMFRKEYIKEIKFYEKKYFYSNDYNFYLKIFKVSNVKLINKFYTYYRVHKEQRTNNLKAKTILKEQLSHLLWSLNNRLINNNNIILFLGKFTIVSIKLFIEFIRTKKIV